MNACPLRLIGELMKPIKMDTASLKLIWEIMTLYPMDGRILSEVDWGALDSSLFLYLVQIDHDAKPKDFFTQGLWGGLPPRTPSTPLMEYLKDSLDTGKLGFSNSKSIKGYRGSYSLPDPEQHESSYNLLTQWDPGEKLFANSTLQEGKHK